MSEEKQTPTKWWVGPMWFSGIFLALMFAASAFGGFEDRQKITKERQEIIDNLNSNIKGAMQDVAYCFPVHPNLFKNRGEKQNITIAPSEVAGINSFQDLDALNAACMQRRHEAYFKQEVEGKKAVYASVMDSFLAWKQVGCDDESFCAVRTENLNEDRWADLIATTDPFWLVEADVTLNQIVIARVTELQVAIAFYQSRLENFSRMHDYHGNSPRWLKDKIMGNAERLYGSKAEIPESLTRHVDRLEREAYARQIDFMVQKLKAGADFPESKELTRLIEQDLEKTGFSIQQFGLTHPELHALVKQNPAEGY
ncbi:MAG: hypothetical protein NT003_02550 [Candidatus Magasanikbacteria bacterium]|nr:hypothetical protein [Candidatus Magasanikbacteria bacterium]